MKMGNTVGARLCVVATVRAQGRFEVASCSNRMNGMQHGIIRSERRLARDGKFSRRRAGHAASPWARNSRAGDALRLRKRSRGGGVSEATRGSDRGRCGWVAFTGANEQCA